MSSAVLGCDSLEKRKPVVHLDLDNKMVKAVAGFKPNQVVKLSIVGTIESVSFHKPYDSDQPGLEGNLSIQVDSLAIDHSVKNELAELFEEDE